MDGSLLGELFWNYVVRHFTPQHIFAVLVTWLVGINQYIGFVPVSACYIFIAACFNLAFPEVLRGLTWKRIQEVIKRIFLLTTPWILFHIGWIPINRLMWITMNKYQPGMAETWMPLLSVALSILCLVASVIKSIGFKGIFGFFDDIAHGTGKGIKVMGTGFVDIVRGTGSGVKMLATGGVVITRGSGRGLNMIVIGLYGLLRILKFLGLGFLKMPVVAFHRVFPGSSRRPMNQGDLNFIFKSLWMKAPDPDVRTTRSGRVYGRWN